MSLLGKGYYAAEAEGAKRRSMQGAYDIRARQKKAGFGFAAQLLNLGSNIWDIYSSNKKLIDYAESKGLRTTSSKFSQIFGGDLEFESKESTFKSTLGRSGFKSKPKFSDISSDKVHAMKFLDEYRTDMKMLDILGGGL